MNLNIQLHQSSSLDTVSSLAFWRTYVLALLSAVLWLVLANEVGKGGRGPPSWGIHWLSLLMLEAPKCSEHILTLFYLSKGFNLLFILHKCVEISSLMTLLTTPTLLCFSVPLWSQKRMGTNACAQFTILNWQWKCLLIYSGIIPSCFSYLSIPPVEFSYILF